MGGRTKLCYLLLSSLSLILVRRFSCLGSEPLNSLTLQRRQKNVLHAIMYTCATRRREKQLRHTVWHRQASQEWAAAASSSTGFFPQEFESGDHSESSHTVTSSIFFFFFFFFQSRMDFGRMDGVTACGVTRLAP
jgi:hypothetical protein